MTIQHGESPVDGGGIFNGGRLTLDNVAVLSNTASSLNDAGGGIYSFGPMTITNSLIRGIRPGR